MKNSTKKYLLSTLALSTAFCGLLGVKVLGAKADETNPFDSFAIESEAEVRTEAPVGIRFVTMVNADQLAAAEEFGTLVIPKTLLDGDLTVETEKAAKIVAEKWLDEEQSGYAGVIVGEKNGENFTDLPESFYDDVLVARSYAVVEGEYVYSTNVVEQSIAQVAANALQHEQSDLLQEIVDYVLGEDFAFAQATVEMEISADPVAVALDAKGLDVVIESGDPDIAYYADGKVHAGTKAGTTAITAKIGEKTTSISVKVDERTYEYGEISDMTYGSDAFYHDYLAWGASMLADLGSNYKGKTVDYGVAKTISDDDYQALLDAGYNGTKTSKTVWSTRAPLHSAATADYALHNGKAALISLGSKSFNEAISDLIDDTTLNMNGAYISVWVRASEAVAYGYTNLAPMSLYGAYSGRHLDASYEPSGAHRDMHAANEWVEIKFDVQALRDKFAGKDIKGLGFQFYLRTDTAAQSEAGDGIDIEYFDIYSIELRFANSLAGYTFASNNVSIPALGVSNFTENLVVKSGDDELVQGVDYTYENGILSGLAAGAYTLEQTVSGEGIAQRTFVRSYTLSNQVANANTTDVVWAGWHAAGFAGSNITLDAKPDGYHGTKTDLSAVAAPADKTVINKDLAIFRAGINISALTKNVQSMEDDQYLSVWLRLTSNGAPNLTAAKVSLVSGTNGNNFGAVALKSGIVSNAQAHAGAWVNLIFTKAQLNVEGKDHLYLEFHDNTKNLNTLEIYAIEVLSFVNSGVVDLNPSLMQSAGWGGTALTEAEGKDHRFATIAAPTAADGYNGPNHGDWALAYTSTDSYVSTAINISSFIANYNTLMDDNDVIEIWVRGTSESSIWKWFTYLSEKPTRNTGSGAHYKVFEQTTTITEDKWFKIEISKEQIDAACEVGTINWLRFYQTSDKNKTTHIYIYDILLVKNA